MLCSCLNARKVVHGPLSMIQRQVSSVQRISYRESSRIFMKDVRFLSTEERQISQSGNGSNGGRSFDATSQHTYDQPIRNLSRGRFSRESQTLTMDEIKKKIDAIEERNPDEPFSVVEIIKSFMDRKQGDAGDIMPSESLSTSQLLRGIKACATIADIYFSSETPKKSKLLPEYITRGFINKLSFWMYDELSLRNGVRKATVTTAYETLMMVCAFTNVQNRAEEVLNDYHNIGKCADSEVVYRFALICLVRGKESDLTPERSNLIETCFEKYASMMKSSLNYYKAQPFLALAEFYQNRRNKSKALAVLQKLQHDLKYKPNQFKDVEEILKNAIFSNDSTVLRIVMDWFADNSQLHQFPNQTLHEIMRVASIKGDFHLAKATSKIIKFKSGKIGNGNYLYLIKAALLSTEEDIITSIEYLQDAITEYTVDAKRDYLDPEDLPFDEKIGLQSYKQAGIAYDIQAVFAMKQIEGITEQLVALLLEPYNPIKMDRIYYALVDLGRGQGKNSMVPRIVLDAIIETAGRLQLTDRAFATFSEYLPVFEISPDVNSYNALLSAAASSKNIKVHIILSILQDMEDKHQQLQVAKEDRLRRLAEGDPTLSAEPPIIDINLSPNAKSFSILLNAMVKSANYKVVDGVLDHIEATSVHPFPSSLRSLAIAMALNQAGAVRHETSPENLTQPLSISSATWGQRLARTIKLYSASRNMDRLPNFFVKELQDIKEKGYLPKPEFEQSGQKQWKRNMGPRFDVERKAVAKPEPLPVPEPEPEPVPELAPEPEPEPVSQPDEPNLTPIGQEQ